MPQPLSSVKNTGTLIISMGFEALMERPALVAPAMKVIVSWSDLEGIITSLFVKMLGAKSGPAAEIYRSLTSAAAQRAALRSAATYALPNERRELFEALLALLKAPQKGRNRVAHWHWGLAVAIPDGVLLSPPDHGMQLAVESEEFLQRMREFWDDPARRFERPPKIKSEFDLSTVYIYRERDFTEISNGVKRAADFLIRFLDILNETRPQTAAEKYDQLCREPEIHRELGRQFPHRKTAQEAPE